MDTAPCLFDDEYYVIGDEFMADVCTTCRCDKGVHCYSKLCQVLNCNNYITPEGECCPICPNCEYTL